jgi:CDP-4-dehydro-6-deoxyglucose reductase
MSYKITVQPSGREFYSEGRETLLRAGMREGLNLAHQCMNGSCGGCHARLLDGEIEQLRHHDFCLPELVDGKKQFLSCCYVAKSDLQLEMHEISDAREIALQQISTRVSAINKLSPGVVEIHLKTPRSQTLEFLAGQRAQLSFGKSLELSLGIASCPCDGMHLRFHLDRQNASHQGVISSLRKGDKVPLSGPYGSLTLNEDEQCPLVFIAFETGFAQVQSLIDHVISIDENRPVYLIILTRSAAGFYKENHCRAWRDVLDFFRYDIVYMPDNYHADFPQFLRKLFQNVPDREHTEIYSILPEALQTRLKAICQQNNFPDEHFFHETI